MKILPLFAATLLGPLSLLAQTPGPGGRGPGPGGQGGPGGPGGERRPPPNPEEVMQRLDANKDGFLTVEEFLAGPMGQRDPERARGRFKQMDANGDGKVSLEELKAGFQRGTGGPGGPGADRPQRGPEPRPEARPEGGGGRGEPPNPEAIFQRLDTNKDGALSVEEFLAAPMAQRNPDRAKARFVQMDKNRDGKLSAEEFKASFAARAR